MTVHTAPTCLRTLHRCSAPLVHLLPRPAELHPLAPTGTFFVVFRYGAVVLFQQRADEPASQAWSTNAPYSALPSTLRSPAHVVKPVGPIFDAPYPQSPWHVNEHEWRQATNEARTGDDSKLLHILLRPFIHDALDMVLVRAPRACSAHGCAGSSLRALRSAAWLPSHGLRRVGH